MLFFLIQRAVLHMQPSATSSIRAQYADPIFENLSMLSWRFSLHAISESLSSTYVLSVSILTIDNEQEAPTLLTRRRTMHFRAKFHQVLCQRVRHIRLNVVRRRNDGEHANSFSEDQREK